MSEKMLQDVANQADMIVRGYAFTKKEGFISILNLNRPDSAMCIAEDGTMLESSMDEIEQAIVQKIWKQDAEFMEAACG